MMEDQIVDAIIEREGGYVNRPEDRGGPTKFGITLATLRAWRGNPALTARDVEALSRDEARLIYRRQYISGPCFDMIADSSLRAQLVDFGVNSGPQTAIRKLQEVLGIAQDGIIGPETHEAIRRTGPAKVNNLLMAARLRHYGRIVSHDHTQAVFISGWINRALDFLIA